VVKTVAVVQAVNYPAMISEENPVKQPKVHSNPAHSSLTHCSHAHSCPAHKSTANSSSAHSNLSDIIEVERDGDSKQADMFKVERDGPTKGKEPITKKAVERTTLAMQAAEKPMAKPDDEREDCSDEDSNDEEEKPAAEAAPAYPVDEVTNKNGESSSEDHIIEDIDVWKALKPTKPNPTTATTKPKLHSNETSTDLAQEANQTEKKPPDKAIEDEEDNENKAEWKDRQSDKPAATSPTNDGGDVNTTEEEIDEPNDDSHA
jgi:hypothetical protein